MLLRDSTAAGILQLLWLVSRHFDSISLKKENSPALEPSNIRRGLHLAPSVEQCVSAVVLLSMYYIIICVMVIWGEGISCSTALGKPMWTCTSQEI